jgi:hypothetical protein
MSICYQESSFKIPSSNRRKIEYRYAPSLSIMCSIEKTKLIDIMKNIFVKYCDISVFGYNVQADHLWGKKIKNGVCYLHFTLSINEISSNIIITPLIGSESEFLDLFCIIKDTINLYQTSDFIQYCIHF